MKRLISSAFNKTLTFGHISSIITNLLYPKWETNIWEPAFKVQRPLQQGRNSVRLGLGYLNRYQAAETENKVS